MGKAKLIIKYDGGYILDKIHNEINFINVPLYNGKSDLYYIDVFCCLLAWGYLDDNFAATRGFNYSEGSEIFESFDVYAMREIDKNIFLYDLDSHLEGDEEHRKLLKRNLENLPGSLKKYSYEELLSISQNDYKGNDYANEDDPFILDFSVPRVDEELLSSLKFLNLRRTDKDVLLLYSGGKDSTLAAVRLRNQGFNVHFIHFDNGAMRDADKPYFTFKNSFGLKDGYYFDYRLRAFNISIIFKEFFDKWKRDNGDELSSGTMTSEIRCLSCRMAMYVEALSYAKANGFKYIAEGARISQKFMLEQEAMTERLKDLASHYGIELIFPVLTLEDDEAEKEELLENGFSSKGWESKCLLGRAAMDKTLEDEKNILSYYENELKPKVLRFTDFRIDYADKDWYLNGEN